VKSHRKFVHFLTIFVRSSSKVNAINALCGDQSVRVVLSSTEFCISEPSPPIKLKT
jgi:hypothetical protein